MEQRLIESLAEQHGTPVLLMSEQRLRDAVAQFRTALPRVGIYYAVKANPHPDIVRIMAEEGCCFDICTTGEIELVRKQGVSAQSCLHTHPIKRSEDIAAALDFGITLFVVDNEQEIEKFIPFGKRARLLIRISIQNPACQVNLSHKFGIPPERAFDLMQTAGNRGLSVAGISFHSGSQNENPLKYIEALQYCRDICARAALAGIDIDIIDIGGGFPISYAHPVPALSHFCQPVGEYLERFFANYRIIAEPGRCIAGAAGTAITRVIGAARRNGMPWYYLDEGIYGLFSGRIFDHAEYPVTALRTGVPAMSVLAGPTCDSFDVIYENIPLPPLEIGDLLVFDSMGAYTNASATNFNGFPRAPVVMI